MDKIYTAKDNKCMLNAVACCSLKLLVACPSQCLAVESDGINFYIVCNMDNILEETCS